MSAGRTLAGLLASCQVIGRPVPRRADWRAAGRSRLMRALEGTGNLADPVESSSLVGSAGLAGRDGDGSPPVGTGAPRSDADHAVARPDRRGRGSSTVARWDAGRRAVSDQASMAARTRSRSSSSGAGAASSGRGADGSLAGLERGAAGDPGLDLPSASVSDQLILRGHRRRLTAGTTG